MKYTACNPGNYAEVYSGPYRGMNQSARELDELAATVQEFRRNVAKQTGRPTGRKTPKGSSLQAKQRPAPRKSRMARTMIRALSSIS